MAMQTQTRNWAAHGVKMLTWDPIDSLHLIARCLFYPLVSLSMKLDAHLNDYFCPEKYWRRGGENKWSRNSLNFVCLAFIRRGRGFSVPFAKEKLYDNGLGSPWWRLEGIARMYLWWIVTAAPLLWDVILKSKILHSLVLVGIASVWPGFGVWCLIRTIVCFLQDFSQKCETMMVRRP